MSFLETKGALAKLLATENLTVQHDSTVRTASFNTSTRVLTLPLLQCDNAHVYDMFVGHEVGHALWTPTDWIEQVPADVPTDYINVIEDVRIERAIQDKFPGLRVDFARGYDYLNQQDFFEIANADFTNMNLVDRINLHFKLGDRALVPFTGFEDIYVRMVSEADTFEKVVSAATAIKDFLNAQAQPQQQNKPQEGESGDSKDEGTNQQQAQAQNGDGEDTSEGGEDEDTQTPSDCSEAGMDQSQSKTQEALDRNLQRLTRDDSGRNRVTYLRAQSTDFADQVTPIEFVREDMETKITEYRNSKLSGVERAREDFNKFMASIKRDVNFMVQQFEMRKSADAYARQQTHRTGVLDTERLHSYKLTDDIFLRQTITPDGKNHGMMMLLDWSGSMQGICMATVKQIIVLTQFCRKVNIPFEVYSFTCQGYGYPFNSDTDLEDCDLDDRVAHSGPQLVNVLSSSVKRRFLEQDMFHLFVTAAAISGYYYTLPVCSYLHMGGTPLNNTLFMLPTLIKKMQARTNAQKVSCVVITDGESSPLYYFSRSFRGTLHHNMINPYDTVLLRDGHRTYQIDSTNTTSSIVDILRTKMPEVSISHIFLGGPRPCSQYARLVTSRQGEEVLDQNQFRKQGAVVVKPQEGWPLVALINPNTFGDAQDELQCDQGSSKAQIRSALRKMLKSKSASKVVLSQLVESFS